MRDVAQCGGRFADLAFRSFRRRVTPSGQVQARPDQLLLNTVMQVALNSSSLRIGGGDNSLLGRSEIVHTRPGDDGQSGRVEDEHVDG